METWKRASEGKKKREKKRGKENKQERRYDGLT